MLLCTLCLAGTAAAQSAATEGEQNMAAGRYTLAGQAYRRAFEQTNEPRYLKLSGQAFMATGAIGRDESIRSFRQYIQAARTLEEAQDGEALLRQAEALPQAAAAPAPVPAPAPAPAPYVPPPQPAPQVAPAPAPAPQPAPAPAPYAPPPAAAPTPAPVAAPAAPAAPPLEPAAPAPGAVPEEPRAEWFGKKGSFVISGERLTMVSAYKTRLVDTKPSPQTQTTGSGTDIALLGSPAGSFGASKDGDILRVSSVPRLAFDYFVAEHFSIGGFLGYAARSGTFEETGNASQDTPSSSLGFIGARGGLYLPLGASLGALFQGGLSYVSTSRTQKGGSAEDTLSLSEVMVNLGANALIPVTKGFGITAGAFFDGSLTGTATEKQSGGGSSASQDLEAGELAYGLTVGLHGWL